jgi:hypothetical protein
VQSRRRPGGADYLLHWRQLVKISPLTLKTSPGSLLRRSSMRLL